MKTKSKIYIFFTILFASAAAFAEICQQAESRPKICDCGGGNTKTIMEYVWRDSQNKICRITSEPCTCPPPCVRNHTC